jgi:hypothetical protein
MRQWNIIKMNYSDKCESEALSLFYFFFTLLLISRILPTDLKSFHLGEVEINLLHILCEWVIQVDENSVDISVICSGILV